MSTRMHGSAKDVRILVLEYLTTFFLLKKMLCAP